MANSYTMLILFVCWSAFVYVIYLFMVALGLWWASEGLQGQRIKWERVP